MVDLAETISEWKDIESNKEDDQYLGDICFSLRYIPTSGKVFISTIDCNILVTMILFSSSLLVSWNAKN